MADPNQPLAHETRLYCGDCRSPIRDPTPAPADDDYYCPRCAKPMAEPITCRGCDSTICPYCATPLERADELGIG